MSQGDAMDAGEHAERGTRSAALGLLLVIGFVGIVHGAGGRPGSASSPPPTGACCYPPYDLCIIVTPAACDSLHGQYIGDSSTCVPLPCTVRGACCLPTVECVLAYPGNCTAQGGIYQGDAHPCDPNPCLPPVPTERVSWGQIKRIYR